MKSIWNKDIKLPRFEGVTEDMRTENLIIGGGMAGLLCGYFFNEQGADYMILEKNRIASGTTGSTTAKITSQQSLIYTDLIKKFGEERAASYLRMSEDALAEFRKLSEIFPCEFEEKDNVVYTLDNKASVCDEILSLEKLGGRGEYTEMANLPFDIAAGVRTFGQAQFHPLKFIAGIAQELNIYENSFVLDVVKRGKKFEVTVLNKSHRQIKILSDRVFVCTHFPFMDRFGSYFLKMYQSRSFVLALKGMCGGFDEMYIGDRPADGVSKGEWMDLSFRTSGDRLLFGGGGGRTGSGYHGLNDLRTRAKLYYPDAEVEAFWSAQDCMTLDGLPYIGEYTKNKEGLYVATGFNKWGMTGAMMSAKILAGLTDEETAAAVRCGRTMMRKQLFVNTFETAKNFLRFNTPRCTHLGCALKWNDAEKSWDCPCHGSTFEKDGKVKHNPSQKPLS